jgi:uncharacterized protein YdeI (YjbR/CyaY-like superfamily)
MLKTGRVVHFESAREFRAWLEANRSAAREIWIGFHTKASGRGGMGYPEALDEALCFGWIDGLRRKTEPDSYTSRFTPRGKGSTWSLVNIRHVERLSAAGRMHAAGLRAFDERLPARTGVYSHEQRPRDLPAALGRVFRADAGAWARWRAEPAGYRRRAIWWIVSAVRPETRLRRLGRVVASAAAGRRLDLLA